MGSGIRGPVTAMIGIAAIGASALAGVGLGNYTIAGTSSFYSENYRGSAGPRQDAMTAADFWDAQGVPRASDARIVPAPAGFTPELTEVADRR